MTEVYPMSKIDIFVQVLQSDGGKHNPLFLHLFAISHLLFLIHTANKAVCINAATMALIDAGVPMKDFVCACSSSLIEDTPVVGMKNSFVYLFDFLCVFSTHPSLSSLLRS